MYVCGCRCGGGLIVDNQRFRFGWVWLYLYFVLFCFDSIWLGLVWFGLALFWVCLIGFLVGSSFVLVRIGFEFDFRPILLDWFRFGSPKGEKKREFHSTYVGVQYVRTRFSDCHKWFCVAGSIFPRRYRLRGGPIPAGSSPRSLITCVARYEVYCLCV